MGLLTNRSQDATQTIVEPLGLVFTNWQLNRVVGKEHQCREILEAFQTTSLIHNSLHEIIGKSNNRRNAKLIQSQELPLVGERRVMEISGKTINAVIGLPEEMKAFVPATDFHSEAIISVEHGLLPLVIASSASSGNNAKYSYVGTLLYEPTVQPTKFDPDNLRILSTLPSLFIAYYYGKIGSFSDLFIDATSFLYDTPTKIEKVINQAAIIGAANLRERYQILALISTKNSYRFVSRNIQDEQLLTK